MNPAVVAKPWSTVGPEGAHLRILFNEAGRAIQAQVGVLGVAPPSCAVHPQEVWASIGFPRSPSYLVALCPVCWAGLGVIDRT